jgi:hypothetical protein
MRRIEELILTRFFIKMVYIKLIALSGKEIEVFSNNINQAKDRLNRF